MAKGSGTRSGLLWEIERILKECDELPQVLLMENVPEVIGQKNKDSFADWIAFLDSMGYKSKWEILNGTDFEIPQNRKRCFMVSVLGDYYYDFPQKLGCTLRLKDLLEKNVSEEYYLSDNILNYFIKHTNYGVGLNESESFRKPPMRERIRTLLANKADCGQGVLISQCECLGMLEGGKWDNSIESSRRVYSTEKAAPTVTTCGGGNQEIKIAEPLALDEQNGYIRQDGTVGTIVTDGSSPKHNNRVVEPMPNMRVRKLTTKECFRLMGVKDEDYERVARHQSKSSLYHLAGDSIVVNVLMAIFKELFM